MDVQSITQIGFSLLTLTFLEIVLGIDNLVFISIASSRLPKHQQKSARRFGLLLALITRLILLACIVWLTGLTKPLFSFFDIPFSGRDIILLIGGLFLLYKATTEIHDELEHIHAEITPKRSSYFSVILQIAILDMVFSFDSIITAIGLTRIYWVMATAITIAIIIMIFASEPLSHFIQRNPTIKMLALSFLLLIGMVLVADGLHYDIPRGYIYFSICFSIFVEILNTLVRRKHRKKSVSKNL